MTTVAAMDAESEWQRQVEREGIEGTTPTTNGRRTVLLLVTLCATSTLFVLLPAHKNLQGISRTLNVDMPRGKQTGRISYAAMSMLLEEEEDRANDNGYADAEGDDSDSADAFLVENFWPRKTTDLAAAVAATSAASPESDTAIIISSSWIPTHPSTYMVDTVVNSTTNFIGLSPSTPIIITVDFLPSNSLTEEKQAALDAYVNALYKTYMTNPRVHVMASMEHWHIGGNVLKALALCQHHFPKVNYLHYMQHDFELVRPINHTALVKTMKNHPQVNYIRFKYKPREQTASFCGNENELTSILPVSGDQTNATIYHTAKYSDNNHFVRFDWYLKFVISPLGFYKRPPENPSQLQANLACASNSSMGLYTYGRPDQKESPVLRHLDGRQTRTNSGGQRFLRWQN